MFVAWQGSIEEFLTPYRVALPLQITELEDADSSMATSLPFFKELERIQAEARFSNVFGMLAPATLDFTTMSVKEVSSSTKFVNTILGRMDRSTCNLKFEVTQAQWFKTSKVGVPGFKNAKEHGVLEPSVGGLPEKLKTWWGKLEDDEQQLLMDEMGLLANHLYSETMVFDAAKRTGKRSSGGADGADAADSKPRAPGTGAKGGGGKGKSAAAQLSVRAASAKFYADLSDANFLWRLLLVLSDEVKQDSPGAFSSPLYEPLLGTKQLSPPLRCVTSFLEDLSRIVTTEGAADALPPETIVSVGHLLVDLLVLDMQGPPSKRRCIDGQEDGGASSEEDEEDEEDEDFLTELQSSFVLTCRTQVRRQGAHAQLFELFGTLSAAIAEVQSSQLGWLRDSLLNHAKPPAAAEPYDGELVKGDTEYKRLSTALDGAKGKVASSEGRLAKAKATVEEVESKLAPALAAYRELRAQLRKKEEAANNILIELDGRRAQVEWHEAALLLAKDPPAEETPSGKRLPPTKGPAPSSAASASSASPGASTDPPKSKKARMHELKELYDDGLITKEEFTSKRHKILDEI